MTMVCFLIYQFMVTNIEKFPLPVVVTLHYGHLKSVSGAS